MMPHVPHGEPPSLVLRPSSPIRADHPVVGLVCPLCDGLFRPGEVLTLFPLNGQTNPAAAVPTHWSCARAEQVAAATDRGGEP